MFKVGEKVVYPAHGVGEIEAIRSHVISGTREYTEKIKTGSILEIAKVLRDLFVLKGDKELSFGERKMLDTARNLLVKELSIARSHSEEKIMEELRHIFTH